MHKYISWRNYIMQKTTNNTNNTNTTNNTDNGFWLPKLDPKTVSDILEVHDKDMAQDLIMDLYSGEFL